jgi:transcriptional regulator with XRE-family HTH domain
MSSSPSSIPILSTRPLSPPGWSGCGPSSAFRLAEMRRRLGITEAEVAARMGVTQGRVSAVEHAKPGTTELRTLAAYVEALGGCLEIIADFGDQRPAFFEPGTEAA